MTRSLKTAAIQMDVTPAPVPERLARITDLVAEAAQQGAQLVVLPEFFNTGYEWHERNYARAETIDGQTITWMKTRAAEHNMHIAGSLLLRDDTEIYNAGMLIAPDGRLWRYDKHYVPLWERAYFCGGKQITIADTDLGRIGMMICWDQYHSDLWADYAGKVDMMVIMSCPGDIGSGELIFPDGVRAKFMDLWQQADENSPENDAPEETMDIIQQNMAWLGIPLIHSSATGTIRTGIPSFEWVLEQSRLAERATQGSETILECGFGPNTRIVNVDGQTLAQGTPTGDALILAEVKIPDEAQTPQTPQPEMEMNPAVYELSDVTVPALMLPLYKDGVRRHWGAHMVAH